MSSVLRPVRKRKKVRKLGRVDIIRREDYAELELDTKVELIRSVVPLGLMHVEEVLDEEVTALAGERDARKTASVGGRRHDQSGGRQPDHRCREIWSPPTRCAESDPCTLRHDPQLLDAVGMAPAQRVAAHTSSYHIPSNGGGAGTATVARAEGDSLTGWCLPCSP